MSLVIELAYNQMLQLKAHIEKHGKVFNHQEKKQTESIITMKYSGEKKALIDCIFTLKDVDLISLLTYGYYKLLVDERFLIEFAFECFARKQYYELPLILDLASLPVDGYITVKDLMKPLIDQFDYQNYQNLELFNGIWMYLVVAGHLREKNLLVRPTTK